MNVIIFNSNDVIGDNRIRLNDARFQQIKQIHRSKLGDTVKIGELNGLMGQGMIELINDEYVELSVDLDQAPPKKLPLTIILALPRPKMIRRIFRTIAELGVEQLIIINSYKVEKSFWQSPAIHQEKVQGYLIEGLQQAKDTVLPKVSFKHRFKPFVEDELPAIAKDSRALIAHPGIGINCPHRIDEPVTLAIGPEGGFTPYEVKKILATGFEGIHLGERILKVENALTTLIAKLYS